MRLNMTIIESPRFDSRRWVQDFPLLILGFSECMMKGLRRNVPELDVARWRRYEGVQPKEPGQLRKGPNIALQALRLRSESDDEPPLAVHVFPGIEKTRACQQEAMARLVEAELDEPARINLLWNPR
jgi:hypothetical protein